MMCYNSRKKRINELTDDEIVTLIRQKIGLKYLLPIAVCKIEKYMNSLTDIYLGGLLDALLNLENKEWINNEKEKEKLIQLLFDCSCYMNEEYLKKSEKYLKEKK